jgi:hypothetical protein
MYSEDSKKLLFTKCYWGSQIKDDEVDGVFNTLGGGGENEYIYIYKIWVGKLAVKRPPERPRHSWEDNLL